MKEMLIKYMLLLYFNTIIKHGYAIFFSIISIEKSVLTIFVMEVNHVTKYLLD